MLKPKKRPKRHIVNPTLFQTRYKARRAGGELWRLMEYREVTTKRKNVVHRWVCIGIGTKAMQDVAFKLNLIPSREQ